LALVSVGNGGVHRLFEEHAFRNPDAAAIVAATGVVSYGELNARANALAHRLLARGAGSGALVGLLADRSVEMVAGILGILKAGAAYVPLYAADPIERLAFVVRDASLPLIVTAAPFDTLATTLGEPIVAFPSVTEHSDCTPDVED